MGSDATSEPSADGVATDAAGGSREPTGGSGGLAPSYGVASPLLLQLTQDQSWLPSIDLYEGPKYYLVVMDVPPPPTPPTTSLPPSPPSTPLNLPHPPSPPWSLDPAPRAYLSEGARRRSRGPPPLAQRDTHARACGAHHAVARGGGARAHRQALHASCTRLLPAISARLAMIILALSLLPTAILTAAGATAPSSCSCACPTPTCASGARASCRTACCAYATRKTKTRSMWRWRVRAYSGAGHGPGYLCTVVLEYLIEVVLFYRA